MKKEWMRGLVPFGGLLAVIILFVVLTGGKTISINNIKLIIEQAILVMLGSLGVLFVMSMGGLDFSQGSILGIGTIVVTVVSHVSFPLAIVTTLLVGTVIGIFNGFVHVKFRIPSFIVTICVMFIFRGLTQYITRKEALQIPFWIYNLDELYIKLPVLIILLFIGYYIFTYTKIGRHIRGIGAGETASYFAGVNVKKTKIMAFGIAGFMAGVASVFNMIRTGTATANTGAFYETDILLALVLGGLAITGGAKSRFSSVIIGCLVLAVLSNGLIMLGVPVAIQQLIKGAVFLGTVALTVERGKSIVVK